jgi:hypothetical protein
VYLSEGRHEHSHAEAHRVVRAILAGARVEDEIVGLFVGELGVHEGIAGLWRPSFAAIERAIDAEALFPLRALAETVQDMADEDPERGYGFYREAVNELMRRAVEGDLDDLDVLWSVPFDREPHRLVKEIATWCA